MQPQIGEIFLIERYYICIGKYFLKKIFEINTKLPNSDSQGALA